MRSSPPGTSGPATVHPVSSASLEHARDPLDVGRPGLDPHRDLLPQRSGEVRRRAQAPLEPGARHRQRVAPRHRVEIVERRRHLAGGVTQLVEADAPLPVDKDRELGPVDLDVDQVQAAFLEQR